jgi:HK97 gp10 family phage protein
LRAAVNPMVKDARLLAPRNTGKGAKSIRGWVKISRGNGVARVTWDKKHYYMRFHETGTRKMSARPFLRPAFDTNRGNSVQRFIAAAQEEIRKFDAPPEGGPDEFEVAA